VKKIKLKRSLRSLALPVLALCASAFAPAAVAASPHYDHVVVVMEENTSEGSIYGNANAPYINSLKDNGVYFTQSFAITHPSQPNYLALFSGATQGVTDDSCPHTFSANNLGNQLRTAGYSFTGYSESMPSNGYTGCTSGNYARKHSPWTNFSDLPATTNLTYASFPTDFTTLPTVSFVIPNLCDDMHDCATATGDTWLKNNLDTYAQWAKGHNSLLIVTWDEDDSTTSANQIATVFYGANLKNGAYAETITHYTVLRTIEDMYGLTALGGAANVSPLADVWGGDAPDFSLSVAPATLSVQQGKSAAATVTVSSINGFSSPVTFSASGLPSGVTASFSPTSSGPNGTSTLTLTAAANAAPGTATITVTASSNGPTLAHTATINLSVTPTPDFALSAAPQTLTIALGSSGNDTISVASLNAFNSAVNLSVSGLPAGASSSFSTNPVTPAANGSAGSVLTINVPATSNLGAWTVTVSGSSGGVSHSATFTLSVVQPQQADFSVSASPTSLSLAQGAGANDTITVLSVANFNSPVSLSIAGLPSGVTAAFAPATVTPAAGGSGSSTLTLSASATAATGNATLAITATSGSLTHTTTIALSVTPGGNVLQNGVPVTGLSGAKGAQLSYTVNVPAGASNLVIATSGGSGDEDMYVRFGAAPTTSTYDCRPYVSGNAESCSFAQPKVGTYYVMLNGYAAFSGVTLKATWSSSAADFGLSANQSSLSVTQGASVGDALTVTSLGAFAAAVNLAVSGLPSGVSASFAPSTVSPAANGSVNSILTLTAAAGAATGTSTLTVTGTSGSLTHTVTIALTVNPSGGTTQLLANTGFESTGSWTASSGVICATGCSGESAHAGSGFAWLDGYGSTHTDTLSQSVAIPSGKSTATLQYWLHVDTAETSSSAVDKLTVQVLNGSGTVLATLATFSNLDAASGYVVHSADLSAYIGQTVTLKFSGTENSSNQTSFVLDDVTLTVQ